MSNDMRGKIIHRDMAKQLRNFDGLRWGNITPTDIDCFIEYKNLGYIIVEAKHIVLDKVLIKRGQELAYTRMQDDLEKVGKKCLLIICEHNTPLNVDVEFAKCKVMKYRLNNEWKTPIGNIDVLSMCNFFINEYLE
jgi:hypothetical protein